MPFAYAQSIAIQKSPNMANVRFDGQWSFAKEWKESSSDGIITEIAGTEGIIPIRTAHDGNFIYILLDVVPDKNFDNNQDWAQVCFDTKSDKSAKPDKNDYCFMIKLGSDIVTMQGNDSDELVVLKNHADLIGIGGLSADRYSQKPHLNYEFRIPLEFLERTNEYGFYVAIFNFANSETYTFPPEIDLENSEIPSPNKWGIIYSPDKTIPEFQEIALMVLGGSIALVIVFARKFKVMNRFTQ
jgi:predicted secreted protein with PEFG-CTERM motif